MRILPVLLCCLACVPTALAQPEVQPAPPRRLPAAGAEADVALLRRALLALHPGYDRYATAAERDTAWARLSALARTGPDELRFYGEVSALLAILRCDHTKATPREALVAWRNTHPTHLPFQFRLFDGRMYVDVAAAGQGLVRGTEVLALNGTTVARLLATLRPLVSVDGFTDHVRDAKLAGDDDLLGSDFDTFAPAFTGLHEHFELSVRQPDGTEQTLRVQGLTFAAWKALRPGSYRRDFSEATTLRMLNDTTALLDIPTFVNYRTPVDPAERYRVLLDEARRQGARHLVLALGGGGSTDAMVELLRALLPEPFRLGRPPLVRARGVPADLRPYLYTWDQQILDPPASWFEAVGDGWYELRDPEASRRWQPHAWGWRGSVTVLIGPENSSAATLLTAKLVDAGRVRTVGTATGGSAEGPTGGQLVFLTLPHSGIEVRIPLLRSRMDITRFTPGFGVAPDIEVPETLADWLAGRDARLERAVQP
jgi:hypothetical protein